MRRGITGACLVAVMAICAIGGSSASAALSPPEYGRCKAQANGNFYNNGCTKTTMPGKGKYEWFPAREKGELTLPKPGFTLALKPNTTAKFRTQFGETIVCTSVEGTGDVFLGSRAHVATLTFEGCTSAGGFCTSAGQTPGTIVENPKEPLDTALGWLSQAKKKVGALLFESGPKSEQQWLFECSAGSLALASIGGIGGQGIAAVTPSGKMLSSTTLKWKDKDAAPTGRVQNPEQFEGDSGCYCFQVNLNESGPHHHVPGEFIGLTMTLIQTNEEPVEINPVV